MDRQVTALKVTSQRNINIDLLRALVMFFILAEHLIVNGLFNHDYATNHVVKAMSLISIVNNVGFEVFETLCSISVNCFILITGYFLIESEKPKFLKFEQTWLYVFFYSVGICALCYMINLLTGCGDTTVKWLVSSCFVIKTPYFWFVPFYLGLILLSPYLSKTVADFNKQQYLTLLSILIVMSINIYKFPFGEDFGANKGCSLLFFITLYYTAGYFKKFTSPFCCNKLNISILVFLDLLQLVILMTPSIIGYIKNGTLTYTFYHLTIGTNGIAYFMSVALFVVILNIKIQSKSFSKIATWAPNVFAVYLITSHRALKYYLYDELGLFSSMRDSIYLIPSVLLVSIVIFVMCIYIDMIREKLFKILKVNDFLVTYNNKVNQLIMRVIG
jgi:brp/blh family beta-carotene 15,15'-monooxygenase